MTKQIRNLEEVIDKPTISIIAAVAENRAIGKDNKLLWDIPEDMKHFKRITMGHVVIMGQKTYESIGKSLPARTNIVLSRDKNFHPEGCIVADSIDDAVKIAKKHDNDEIFFIGGGMVYDAAIKIVDKLYLTIVEGSNEADTYFPPYDDFIKTQETGGGQYGIYKYRFCEFERKNNIVRT